MKNVNLKAIINWKFPVIIATLFAGVIYLSSCSSDDPTPAAPTVSLSSTSAENAPGELVTTTVTVDAPAGGKTLSITVNGASSAALPNVDLAGSTSKEVPVEYTI